MLFMMVWLNHLTKLLYSGVQAGGVVYNASHTEELLCNKGDELPTLIGDNVTTPLVGWGSSKEVLDGVDCGILGTEQVGF